MRRAAAALVQLSAALAATWLGGCSLMDLGDLGLHCEEQKQCDALNERDDLGASDCVIWQCRKDKRGCEKRPRDLDWDDRLDAVACSDRPGPLDCDDMDPKRSPDLSESCDTKDNDCDGLIDEDVAPNLEQSSVGSVQAPDFLSYTQDESDAVYVMLGTRGMPGEAEGWVLAGDEAPGKHAVSYAFPADRASAPNPNRGCAYPDAPHEGGACLFSELATAAVGGELVTAGVNTDSCAAGQMRMGLSDPSDFTVQLGSAQQNSNLEWGVDVVDVADKQCTMLEGAVGARSPRIAALDADASQPRAQALALWLAAASDQPCSGSAPVVALALWPRADASEHWLQGGHGGHGEALGESEGCGAPGVVALRAGKNSGYAIGYPGSSDAIELVWLPRPSGLDASLPALARHATLPAAEPTHVSLAMLPDGETTASGRGLLVAFREGGESSHALGFAPIGWSADGLVAGDAQTLEREAEIIGGPVSSYARTGFAMEALDDSESTGGWLIMWIERDAQGSHLLGLRVADVGGGTRLGEPFAFEGGGDPQFPFVCAEGSHGFEYGFVARDGSAAELTVGNLGCPASG